jgi:hypothetical protein
MMGSILLSPLASNKIQRHPRDRLAVVYVRQSTVQHMLRHQESTRLQYGLVDYVLTCGWTQQQVLVIDEDLGKSGTMAEACPGLQCLVAEVSLAHVGIVFGVDISRLARSNRDWHHLLEVCALFGTLIGDLDGIYDPLDDHDRLLLGLKGTMKDPDEQTQTIIALIFEQFERYVTVGGVLRYLVQHGIQLPCRVLTGPNKGDLAWRRPSRHTLSYVRRHPMYAGAYVYGRRRTEPRHKLPGRPGTGQRVAAPDMPPRRPR